MYAHLYTQNTYTYTPESSYSTKTFSIYTYFTDIRTCVYAKYMYVYAKYMYVYAEYVKRPLCTYEKRPTKETQIYMNRDL